MKKPLMMVGVAADARTAADNLLTKKKRYVIRSCYGKIEK